MRGTCVCWGEDCGERHRCEHLGGGVGGCKQTNRSRYVIVSRAATACSVLHTYMYFTKPHEHTSKPGEVFC